MPQIITGDPYQRVIFQPGERDWHTGLNDNIIKTVTQANQLEDKLVRLEALVAQLRNQLATLRRVADVHAFIPGEVMAGVPLLRVVVPPERTLELPLGLAGYAHCVVPPRVGVATQVLVQGVSVGTLSVPAGSTRGEIITSRRVVLQSGEVLEIAPLTNSQTGLKDLTLCIRLDEV